MSKKSLEILNSFTTDKKVEFEQTDSWSKDTEFKVVFGNHYAKQKNGEEWKDLGPFSYEEAFKYRAFPGGQDKKLTAYFIPEKLYNKSFKLGDYEISVTHKTWSEKDDYEREYSSYGYKEIFHRTYNQWGVYVNFHGVYRQIGRFKSCYSIQVADCLPTQSNWFHIKPTKDKPCIMKNTLVKFEYEYYNKTKEFFDSLDINSLELQNTKVGFQEWYDFDLPSEKKKVRNKSISDLSLDEKDVEWFIKSETKDGVYRPERPTIDRWLFDSKNYSSVLANKYDKKILQNLGIHTVQLRADAHYNVPGFFDMKGIKIKAPQKVIERYRLEKHCKDETVVEKIKAEKKKQDDEQKARDYNNKFTLMQHGKVIKSNKDKEDIIEYLENFYPASTIKNTESKKSSSADIESDIIKTVKPIFDEFEDVDKIYIAYWGRFFKYECAGETKDIDYECDHMNEEIIDEDSWTEIKELYSDNLCPDLDEKIVENKYGWPERGGIILGVEKIGKGKLKVFTEDYDFE